MSTLIDEPILQLSVARGDTAAPPFITPWISLIRHELSGGGAIGAALLPFFDLLLPSPMATA